MEHILKADIRPSTEIIQEIQKTSKHKKPEKPQRIIRK